MQRGQPRSATDPATADADAEPDATGAGVPRALRLRAEPTWVDPRCAETAADDALGEDPLPDDPFADVPRCAARADDRFSAVPTWVEPRWAAPDADDPFAAVPTWVERCADPPAGASGPFDGDGNDGTGAGPPRIASMTPVT